MKKIIKEYASTKAYIDRLGHKNSFVNTQLKTPEKDESIRIHLDEMASPTGPEDEDHQPPLDREFKRCFALTKFELDESFNLQ